MRRRRAEGEGTRRGRRPPCPVRVVDIDEPGIAAVPSSRDKRGGGQPSIVDIAHRGPAWHRRHRRARTAVDFAMPSRRSRRASSPCAWACRFDMYCREFLRQKILAVLNAPRSFQPPNYKHRRE